MSIISGVQWWEPAEWTLEAREPRIERETLVWHPVGASAPFTLALAELFRPV